MGGLVLWCDCMAGAGEREFGADGSRVWFEIYTMSLDARGVAGIVSRQHRYSIGKLTSGDRQSDGSTGHGETCDYCVRSDP